ncbi:MAG: permease [Pseudomonadota bacterium]
MTDTSLPAPARDLWRRTDTVWLVFAAIIALLAVLAPGDLPGILGIMLGALGQTAIFITFAVLAVAFLKATGAEVLLARAFEGNEARMIVMAALLGGLSPFCSCEVIPFVAALLALGTPLSAVMAFWLASPLMDPAMFIMTSAELGLDFAIAKTIAAVALGLFGGFSVRYFAQSRAFADPLKPAQATGCGCGARKPFIGTPVWRFWTVAERRETFLDSAFTNARFLLKWLAVAYLFEAMMITYVPADAIATFLGGEGFLTVLLATVVGMPAYLNGYAAVGLLGGLLDQGMAPGAAMSFVIAGGVSSIPAAIAVWALVKPRVFAGYIGFAFVGALAAGMLWNVIA